MGKQRIWALGGLMLAGMGGVMALILWDESQTGFVPDHLAARGVLPVEFNAR